MYHLFLIGYYFVLKLASFFNDKAKLWIEGRKVSEVNLSKLNIKNCIWFHASSLGEFEQVSYLIQQIKTKFPSEKILVTFYSPSGYEVKKDFKFADKVMYLPFDFKSDMIEFLDIIQPRLVFWVRYEFWINTLTEIKKRNIPIYLLNGVFSENVSFIYKPILKRCLSCFTRIYVISQSSNSNLAILGFASNVLFDTRFDRMNETKQEEFKDEKIEQFVQDKKVVVCGSIWSNDDDLIKTSLLNSQDVQWILVPHHIDKDRIDELKTKFPQANTYSNFDFNNTSNIFIVDTIGYLSKIYRYADLAYIGGGFDKVVHSLIEPLAYSIPIIIGKNIEKSEEAKEFVEKNIVAKIHTSTEFESLYLQYIYQDNNIQKAINSQLFNSRLGSIDKILELV